MKTTTFTVEKTGTGYSAYYEENDNIVAVTTGSNLTELRNNALESYNLHADYENKKPATLDQIKFKFDLASVFEFYPAISSSGVAAYIGMQKSVMSEYINGKRIPSEKQITRILTGIKHLGRELSELDLV